MAPSLRASILFALFLGVAVGESACNTSDVGMKAEKCCVKAFPLLKPGAKCDVDAELGKIRVSRTCEKTLVGMRILLERSNLDVAECK